MQLMRNAARHVTAFDLSLILASVAAMVLGFLIDGPVTYNAILNTSTFVFLITAYLRSAERMRQIQEDGEADRRAASETLRLMRIAATISDERRSESRQQLLEEIGGTVKQAVESAAPAVVPVSGVLRVEPTGLGRGDIGLPHE
jgi:hypothetical protein